MSPDSKFSLCPVQPDRLSFTFAAPRLSPSWTYIDDRCLVFFDGWRFDNCVEKSYDLFEKRGYSHAFVSLSKKLKAEGTTFFLSVSNLCERSTREQRPVPLFLKNRMQPAPYHQILLNMLSHFTRYNPNCFSITYGQNAATQCYEEPK